MEKIPKIIFIVPYRNREIELIHFKVYMSKYILEDYDEDDYKIFFIHQHDNRQFNRGAMKNIGFLAMKEKYPDNYKDITFVFNDVDTVPAFKKLINYETKEGFVKHFYGFTHTLGGIVSIIGKDFEKINGFPNYWAWGLEDNDLQHRVYKNNIKIDRSVFFKATNPIIINLDNRPSRIQSKEQPWRSGPNNKEGFNNIKNLKYEFDKDMINVFNFTTLVDPKSEHFFNKKKDPRIDFDKNFKPKDSNVNSSPYISNAQRPMFKLF